MYENEITKNNGEREVGIIQLIFQILYGWRFIVLSMIIFAVLFYGQMYVRDMKIFNAANAANVLSLESIEKNLTEKELFAVSKAKIYREQLEDKRSYKDNSVYLNIDAYAKNVITMQYFVNIEDSRNSTSQAGNDYTEGVVECYDAYVEDKGILKDIRLDYGEEERYMGELIASGKRVGNKGEAINTIAAYTDTFAIHVSGEDLAQANALADKVEEAINKYQTTLDEKIGSHKLILIKRFESIVVDSILAAEQEKIENAIIDLQTKLDTLTVTFTNEQNWLLNGEIDEEFINSQNRTGSVPSIKNFVLGAVIGGILATVVIVLRYILTASIKTVQELQNMWGLRVFGTMSVKSEKKRFMSFVDSLIDRLARKHTKTFEEQKELITANLAMTCKRENIKHLFINTSLDMDKTEQSILDELVNELEKLDIKATIGANIMESVSFLEKLTEINNLIVFERLGKSTYKKIEKELMLCRDNKVNVLGAIVLEK